MAVLDTLRGLDVSICIDGQPLKEYDDDEEEEVQETPVAEYQAARTVRKYVESVSDKEFEVKIVLGTSFVMDYDCIMAPITIDGKRMIETVIVKARQGHIVRGSRFLSQVTRTVRGVTRPAPGANEQEFLRKFRFEKIGTTMDDVKLADVKQDMERIEEIGEIIVKIFRGGPAEATEETNTNILNLRSMNGPVHEKALKGDAKSHNAALGPATQLVPKSYVNSKKLDGIDYPIAIFKFKYRSRDALKSLLIIERSPSPEAEEEPVPEQPALSLDNLNPTQKARLEQFLRELVNGGDSRRNTPNRTIKRERDENEGSEASRKKRRSGPPVTIDLTDD
ncbi:hypothetical protein N431DRAFT_494137 [Stipitochalara longipes BDJ]|nr:hypothetical protein N431DRAFT_494137 [Stipitochalara longipes BDJ]